MNIKLKTDWHFDNSYQSLPKNLYSRLQPTSVSSPAIVLLNDSLAEELGLDIEMLRSQEGISVLAGNQIPEGAEPLAQAYAGHQFGYFTMLGDGRALLLGEQISPTGERVDIQLKGAGPTPYSRGGDGRAALGPMLREYLISEAMHALRIPTSRGLAVVTTGESVLRETELPGAILTRVASSHLRVGTFQYVANWGTAEDLQALADYTIRRHFPTVADAENRYLLLLQEVIKRQAELIAKWQLVGFIHGVMNTDNMTISGETIDYGPCAFMDTYDPATVFSSIDAQGRYAYGNQPPIAQWNLARFAESLLSLLHEDEKHAIKLAQEALSDFATDYHRHWLSGMRGKLGIYNEEKEDERLIKNLLNLMKEHHADYTNTFPALTFDQLEEIALFRSSDFKAWHRAWKQRLERQEETQEDVQCLMRKQNPAIIPRNHRVEEALDAAISGNLQVMKRFLQALANPYAHSPEQEDYAQPSSSDQPYQTFCGT